MHQGYTYSIYAFQHETKAETYHEQYGPKIKPGSLIYLIQRGLLYRDLQLQINKDGTRKESVGEVEPFFPPTLKDSKLVGSAGAGNGNMKVDDDEDDERASVATAIQQPPSVTNSRKHGRGEEGANGVSSGGEKTGVPDKKKRRKTGAPPTPVAPTAVDKPDDVNRDKAMVDTLGGQSPIEEIRLTTNGYSIGVQVETVTEITAAETSVLTNEEQKVNALAWSPVQSGKLVSGARSSIARLWSISEGADPPSFRLLDHSSTLTQKQEITAVQWSNDGTLLATATFDGTTKLWNPLGRPMEVLTGKPLSILQLRWNKTSSILLTLYLDGSILAWDVDTAEMLPSFEGKQEVQEVQDVAWVGDEAFAAAGIGGDIVVYEARTGGIRGVFRGEGVGMLSLAWDEFGERLASGDARGRITIWDNSNVTPKFTVQAHGSQVSQLLWQPLRSPQSVVSMAGELSSQTRILASRSDMDTVIRLWSVNALDTTPPTPFLALPHDSSVCNMSFSPDGKYIATGSNRRLFIWRIEDGFLAYAYKATKQENATFTNGDTHGITVPKTNGDVEMGGMDDNEVDTDTDSSKSALDSFDIADISWDIKGTVLAVAVNGLGVGCSHFL
ncbi:WD40-repeat-containing domain protein [Tirmania nivea]|nr:WD40-repeat-containing domain protein [Tirmania nivea]